LRGAAALCALLALQLAGCKPQPITQDYAEVTWIYVGDSKYTTSKSAAITFRNAKGFVGTKVIPAEQLNCKEHDTIKVHVQGVVLTMDEGECIR
jgi:uncharacterized membrane protein YecN with MAPEG domain